MVTCSLFSNTGKIPSKNDYFFKSYSFLSISYSYLVIYISELWGTSELCIYLKICHGFFKFQKSISKFEQKLYYFLGEKMSKQDKRQ